jgi:hypothetical protein
MYLSTLGWTPSIQFCSPFVLPARPRFVLISLHHYPNDITPARPAKPLCVSPSGLTLTPSLFSYSTIGRLEPLSELEEIAYSYQRAAMPLMHSSHLSTHAAVETPVSVLER